MEWLIGVGILTVVIVLGVTIKYKTQSKDRQFNRDQYEGKKGRR